MLIPKKTRQSIFKHLFKEGVMVAKKDFNAPKHTEVGGCSNLEVIKTMQSLKSRGYVREQFAWRHFYWYLTDEGIDYLREYLHLPSEVVPDTMKRSANRPERRPPMGGAPRSGGFGGDSDRNSYRRPGMGDKKLGAGSDFKPEFRGGYGRGRGGPAGGEGGAGAGRGRPM